MKPVSNIFIIFKEVIIFNINVKEKTPQIQQLAGTILEIIYFFLSYTKENMPLLKCDLYGHHDINTTLYAFIFKIIFLTYKYIYIDLIYFSSVDSKSYN